MPFDSKLIEPAVDRYRRERDRYIKLADRIAEICRDDICNENAIRAQVTFRAKSISSFEGKLRRFLRKEGKNFRTVDDIFDEISDLSGVRIATYRQEDLNTIVEAVQQVFIGPDGGEVGIDVKDRQRQDPKNFYVATHAQVALPEDTLIGTYDNLDDVSCEIQICTMMAHVWNEIEHDIGYKPHGKGPSDIEKRFLAMLGNNVRMGDGLISQLLAANEARENAPDAQFEDVHDFVARVRREYDVRDFSKHSGQLFEQLVTLELTDPDVLAHGIEKHDQEHARNRIAAFNTYLARIGAPNLQMDEQTSDIVLIQLLDKQIGRVLASHKGRVGRGRGRPSRLYRLARHYQVFFKEAMVA
ncbi:MAG: hypothetical protein R8G60_03425 [Roseovarius pacificus]|nr:hypothetical protein [Roseovarius pacificus]